MAGNGQQREVIRITFPDGSERTFPKGITGRELAEQISPRLAREALAIKVNGEVWDLTRPIEEDARVRILTWEDPEGKAVYWHSTAHLMAEALEALYPGVKFGIGPPIEQGFYYDVDLGGRKLSAEDLARIEEKMRELARRDVPYERIPVSKQEALEYFKKKGDPYKVELIEELEDGTITFYRQGNFTDLCRGPHVPSTGYIKHVKLLNVAGAYWRGDERRPQLTRIYGISFPKKKELDEYLHRLEEARKRDHRRLGRELELFTFSQKVGPGLPLWLPRGATLRETLINFLREEQIRRGYQPVVTPHIARLELYKTSGHYPYYKDSQFPPMIENPETGEGYLLKPMNCPHHIMIYADRPRSYRELPIRLAEFGQVYRYEQTGELSGLTRVRGFTIDDAHIFCRPDQVKDEFKNVIDLTLYVFRSLGFDEFEAQISLRDPNNREKYVGDDELWEQAEQAIREAAAEMGLQATEELGEAAFYGPKLDFMVRDALGRRWQLGTVQLDYILPERFDLYYIGADNQKHRPVMIHRAPFGSLERFIGVLIEHCAGNFPLWLAPVQVAVLPLSDELNDYAEAVGRRLLEAGFRVEVDTRTETIGYKIRQAEVQKIPYMLIVGRREREAGTVAVRKHGEGDQGPATLDEFIERLRTEIEAATRRATVSENA
ncbi:threonine--tRNA ligase [Rhodothermus marinus]|uniref:threonine--tRNA ligase n=1 Tax=Rhodothermus marinus TaxID=29549 RepID=UPI0002EFEFC4|nr:threonine--tRNA ligase [Rhodothermus marinus]MBO2492767.1 threonine--tRNA ligase [Rhodothermus marinus]